MATRMRTGRTEPAGSERGVGLGSERAFGVGAIVLGLGTALVTLLGPLGLGAIRYHASQGAVNQVLGGDVAGLLLVAPAAVVAGVLALRRNPAGPVLALGPAAYVLYTETQLALGGDFVRYAGNSERFFLLFLALFVLAGTLLVRAWTSLDAAGLPAFSRRFARFVAGFALVIAAFLVVGLHLPGVVASLRAPPSGSAGPADPAVFWLVKFMDLGVVVPIMVAFALGLLRNRGWAHKAMYAVVGWIALLGTAVAGMAIVMQATGDPEGSMGNVVAFGLFATVGLAVAVAVYRPVLRSGSRPARR